MSSSLCLGSQRDEEVLGDGRREVGTWDASDLGTHDRGSPQTRHAVRGRRSSCIVERRVDFAESTRRQRKGEAGVKRQEVESQAGRLLERAPAARVPPPATRPNMRSLGSLPRGRREFEGFPPFNVRPTLKDLNRAGSSTTIAQRQTYRRLASIYEVSLACTGFEIPDATKTRYALLGGSARLGADVERSAPVFTCMSVVYRLSTIPHIARSHAPVYSFTTGDGYNTGVQGFKLPFLFIRDVEESNRSQPNSGIIKG
ncbi:hypothetical protein DFH06DRAFT_1289533 [Mycena polygramma]|nr:hypothetical protein DFH06DRAFT_1289533 [Mycena polygramma]